MDNVSQPMISLTEANGGKGGEIEQESPDLRVPFYAAKIDVQRRTKGQEMSTRK